MTMEDTTETFLTEPLAVRVNDEVFHLVRPPYFTTVPVWKRDDWKAFVQRHADEWRTAWIAHMVNTGEPYSLWPLERFVLWQQLRQWQARVAEQAMTLFGDKL